MKNQTEKSHYKILKKRTRITLYVLLMLLVPLMLFSAFQAFINTSDVPRNRDISRYKDILTEEEKEDWGSRSVQMGEAVFQLNLEIPVDQATRRGEIRLVHPPFSDFICQVSLTDVESGILLYESEEMIPGTLIQYITLSETMAVGKYDVTVEYTFMDGKKKIHGTYDVAAVLDVKEQDVEDNIISPYDEFLESETEEITEANGQL